MPKVAVMRTIHALPGKREQYLSYLKQADEVRRNWGMVDSLVLEKAVDPTVVVVLQIWENEERYQAWQGSPDRTRVLAEGRHVRVREPSLLYRVLDSERIAEQ